MQTTSKLSGKICALCQIPPSYIPSHSAYLLDLEYFYNTYYYCAHYTQSYIFQVLQTLTLYCGIHNWLRSKMLNHGLSHGLFLSLFKLIPCSIHWIVHVFHISYLNFKAVLALPKMARSAQTYKSISFTWIVWSTLYVYLWLYHWIQCCNVHQYCSGTKQLQLNTLLVLKIELANLEILEKNTVRRNQGTLQFYCTQHRFVFLSVRLYKYF